MQKICRVLALLVFACSIAPAVRAESVIRAVMQTALKQNDPHATTAYLPTWHGYMIYDTLLALDANNQIRPQMAERWDVSADGKTYTITLRPHLAWTDGTPVTAADCVASIRRWAPGDAMGETLLELISSMDVIDDNTFRVVMTVPTDLLLQALSKPVGTTPFIMPKRVAATPLGQPITDMTGSGPFKIVEFTPGVRAVYVKNKAYVPRAEPPSGMAGGKVVNVDKVVWQTTADQLSAANAVIAGTVDYIEQFPYELLPMVHNNPDLVVDTLSPVGYYAMYRFNFTQPPFNNKEMRQAAMYAINQTAVMKALVGDARYWRTCASLWGCGTPYESDIGHEMTVLGNMEKARALLKDAQYDGTPVVMLQSTDLSTLGPQAIVMAQALRQAGFNVTLTTMDWQEVTARRMSKAPPNQGGWNIHNTNWYATDIMDPIRSAPAAADGDKAWYGWPDLPAVEALRKRFALTSDPVELHKIADEIQRIGVDEGLYVPLGQISVPTVYSRHLTGLMHIPAMVFWNVRKTP
jgi:peptide/nickel transport system substrate-binding protein